MRYAVVIERGKRNYGAYVPDVPGCVAVGDTVQEALANIREALEFHLEGMREDGEAIPDPASLVDYVEVNTAPITPNGPVKAKSPPKGRRTLEQTR
jgi:predicted RNase H-like HicB family nuclease